MAQLFNSIISDDGLTIGVFLVIMLSSFFIGCLTAIAFRFKSQISKGFMITLVLIPAIVAIIIIMVNGNLGAGIAVAGAFGLVRFRSAPGTAKEIGAIFSTTASGLILGMGYIAYAIIFAVLICLIYFLLNLIRFGERRISDKILKITIPEDLNYDNVFDELLVTYTNKYELINIKTVNMGSMYKLTYRITPKKELMTKDFIDAIRCLNGNLEVMLTRDEANTSEL